MKSKLIILATSTAAALIPLPAIAQSWDMACYAYFKDFEIDKKGTIVRLDENKRVPTYEAEEIIETFVNFNNEGFVKCIEKTNTYYHLACKKNKYIGEYKGDLYSIIDKNEIPYELRKTSKNESNKCEMINKDTYKSTDTIIHEYMLDYGFNYPVVSKIVEVRFYKLLKPEF